jgi:hypothetical protein
MGREPSPCKVTVPERSSQAEPQKIHLRRRSNLEEKVFLVPITLWAGTDCVARNGPSKLCLFPFPAFPPTVIYFTP